MNGQRVRSPRVAHRTSVCVCWFHPLVVADFRQLLSGNGLRLRDSRLQADAVRNGEPFSLPHASVYVLEGHADPELTQAVILRVLARRPGSNVLVVSERLDRDGAFTLLRLGVKGLMSFREAPLHLRRAVREIANKGCWVSRSTLSRFLDTAARSPHAAPLHLVGVETRLSRREHQVCELVLENLSNRQIASRLDVTERTAKFHVSNLLAKYGVKRRAELVVMGYNQGRVGIPGNGFGSSRRSPSLKKA